MGDRSAGTAKEEIALLRALVHGRVQGVFFRNFVADHAANLGLAGWVRNLPDRRTVEVNAEGARSAVAGLLAYLRQGPPGAAIKSVDVEWLPPAGDLESFEIR